MRFNSFFLLITSLTTAACSSSVDRDSDLRAAEHVNHATLLESSSQWNEAALEYAIVAEHYPSTQYYETSVRRAAILFSHPENELSNDSIALAWLSTYATIATSEDERSLVTSHMKMIAERSRLRGLLSAQMSATDSVAAIATGRQLELEDAQKKIRALEKRLEQEIAESKKELERLRAIDVEVGRNKEKEPKR
jgi:hypothetical protein